MKAVILITKWWTIGILSVLAVGFLFHAATNVQNDPQSVFKAFLEAEKKHDMISLIHLSRDDASFENDVSNQIALLSRGSKSTAVTDYEILTKKQFDDSHVEFTYRITDASGQTTPPLPMTVLKKNGKWIVNMQLVEINGVKNSPDFEKVTKITSKIQHYKEELQSKSSPQMTSVAYWAWKGNQ